MSLGGCLIALGFVFAFLFILGEVLTGDEAFDRSFEVSARDPQRAHAWLDPRRRALVAEVDRLSEVVVPNEPRITDERAVFHFNLTLSTAPEQLAEKVDRAVQLGTSLLGRG